MLTARWRGVHPAWAGPADPVRRLRPDWSAIPIHPLLAAAYPVVFLFATNAAEQVTSIRSGVRWRWRSEARPSPWPSLWLLLRDPLRAALMATVLVIGFFGYGHLWTPGLGMLDSQWPLIIAWGLLVEIGLFAAWRAGRWHAPVTRGAQRRRGAGPAPQRRQPGRDHGRLRRGR